jgi:CHAT domain-containing protein/Tfp pilus assembly protein PilF
MLIRYIFFLSASVLFSSLSSVAQSDDDYRASYKKAEKLFSLEHPTESSDNIALKYFLDASNPALQKKDGKIAVGSLIKAATIKQTHKRFAESIDLYHRSINTNQTYFKDSSLLYESWLYLGSAFYQTGQIDSAQYYFEKASLITMQQHKSDSLPEQERLYNSLGAIYYESANYTQAMNYFQKALQYDDDEETRVTLQSNVANCLVQLSRYNEGIKLFNSLLRSRYLHRITLHNVAHAYFKIGKYDSAQKYFNKVSRRNDDVTVRLLVDLSKIYSANRDYMSATAALDSSLRYINEGSGKSHSADRAMNYLVRSTIAAQQDKTDEAMKQCENAFTELSLDGNPHDVNTISPVLMLDVLKQKAMLLEKKYRSNHAEQYLENCFRTWQQAINVASYIRKYLDNDEAKMYFQQGKGIIFHEAIRIGFEWFDRNKSKPPVNDIIGIMEAYKGTVLLENIKQASSKEGSKIPQPIRLKEKSLRQAISYYTVKLGAPKSSDEAAKLQRQILSARVELSRLQKQYEFHPEYDFYKEDTTQTDFYGRLSSTLDNNTALLSYMQSNENIYALAITNGSFKTQIIKISPELKANTALFTSEVYHHIDGRRYEGSGPSKELYKHLVKPFEDLFGNRKKLVLLPDGLLNYIPFEALAVSNNRDYLVLHKEISYHYSISLLLYNYENPRTNSSDRISLFLAPFATRSSAQMADMSVLPFSLNEVPGNMMTKWIGEKATKKNLLASFENARVIHLATHATSDGNTDGSALIYLFPTGDSAEANNLYLAEIYSLDLHNTDLVILSACETAGGINSAGEGLLSLSRAFMYAGSKGMISTLWKTEDQVSAKMMQYLYSEMAEGYPPEEALQRAKLRFLDDNTISEKYKTPNYWSNFIYVGQIGKKEIHLNASWAYTLVFAFVGVLIWLVYKRRKLPRHSGVASVVEP